MNWYGHFYIIYPKIFTFEDLPYPEQKPWHLQEAIIHRDGQLHMQIAPLLVLNNVMIVLFCSTHAHYPLIIKLSGKERIFIPICFVLGELFNGELQAGNASVLPVITDDTTLRLLLKVDGRTLLVWMMPSLSRSLSLLLLIGCVLESSSDLP